jgi:hypothetical protein
MSPRSGAQRQIGDDEIAETIRLTLQTTPPDATHWSLRSMAAVGHAPSTIHRIWKAFGMQPHRSEASSSRPNRVSSRRCATLSGSAVSPHSPDQAAILSAVAPI